MNNFEIIRLLNSMIDDVRYIKIKSESDYINKRLNDWQKVSLMT